MLIVASKSVPYTPHVYAMLNHPAGVGPGSGKGCGALAGTGVHSTDADAWQEIASDHKPPKTFQVKTLLQPSDKSGASGCCLHDSLFAYTSCRAFRACAANVTGVISSASVGNASSSAS